MVENEDYIIEKVEQKVNHGGSFIKKNYILKPETFKTCLISSKNTDKYRKYYLLLEKVYVNYTNYERSYMNKLSSFKDYKIDNLIKKVDDLKIQNDNLQNQNSELIIYAKDSNNMIRELKIDIASIIKLLSKFLSGSIDLIYTFNTVTNIRKIKCLIVYKLKNEQTNTYIVAIRYCQLDSISQSIKDLLNKETNDGYKIEDYTIIGFLQANLIPVQTIYDNVLLIDKNGKQTIDDDLTENEADNTISRIVEVVEDTKFSFYVQEMNNDENLSKYADSFIEMRRLDNEFNNAINNILDRSLHPKVFENRNFMVNTVSNSLTRYYTDYINR